MVLEYSDELSKTDFSALCAILAITLVQIGYSFSSMNLPAWYKLAQWAPRGSPFRVIGLPPVLAFGVVWTALYFLIATGIYLYYINLNSSLSSNYVWTLFLALISIVLTKFWTIVFFGASASNHRVMTVMFQLAWMLVFVIWGTALTVTILFAIDSEWWSFVLWLPYVLWTTYAFFLQVQFAMIGSQFFSVEAQNTYYAILKQIDLERVRQQQSNEINFGNVNNMTLMPAYGQQMTAAQPMPYYNQQPGGFGTFSSSSYHIEKQH